MRKKKDAELERLENHLAAAEDMQVDGAPAYNRDDADVDLEFYSQCVRGRKKSGCLVYGFIFLILAALAVFLYQIGGGS